MPTGREILTVLVMLLAFGIEVGSHFADRYIEGLTQQAANGSVVKKLLKIVPPAIAGLCLLVSFAEYQFRGILDGAHRGFCGIYYYPEVSPEIPSRLYGSAAQFLTLAFALLHFTGTVVYLFDIKGFRLAIVPMILSTFQVAAKFVDCFRSRKVYVRCEAEGMRVLNATHFRGSLRMDCTICATGCPHRACDHCATGCVHCNHQEEEHGHIA